MNFDRKMFTINLFEAPKCSAFAVERLKMVYVLLPEVAGGSLPSLIVTIAYMIFIIQVASVVEL